MPLSAPASFRLACDTGGTFTDLVVEDGAGRVRLYKAATTAEDPVRGILDVLALAANDRGLEVPTLLGATTSFIHGTTHAINAIVTGRTARTALVTTEGHRDLLLLREGGRADPFDHSTGFPAPYVPRHLTFTVPERVDWAGNVLRSLDQASLQIVTERLSAARAEAVAVCFLWSIVNPVHERLLGDFLRDNLPGVPVTLSHELNPSIREYRRASSACIDASLKPVMTRYIGELRNRLRANGFGGELMILTSQGGMIDAEAASQAPISLINSGPSMAPLAGAALAKAESWTGDVIVADTGGTTYDVSLVREGRVPLTRETWIGEPFLGHMTGFPSVDVRSIGAGGGSVAFVDSGGALHVGPRSTGSNPGPACYGLQSEWATMTDAAVVLGYIDPDHFLGGLVHLDVRAAAAVIERAVAAPLGLAIVDAALAILEVATENMVQAITSVTLRQGVDTSRAILVGGGGAAGLNAVAIARRLGCPTLLISEFGAVLSAVGALWSDIVAEFRQPCFTRVSAFDACAVTAALARLEAKTEAFLARVGPRANGAIELSAEARYPQQAWEIDVPLRGGGLADDAAAELFRADFHAAHDRIFAVRDDASDVEIVGFTARARMPAGRGASGRLEFARPGLAPPATRVVHFPGSNSVRTPVYRFEQLVPGSAIEGPAIVESAVTSVVLNPGARAEMSANGSVLIRPHPVRS